MEMKEWNFINCGGKTALDMPVLVTNFWTVLLRLHFLSRNRFNANPFSIS